jgi:hypothetical protein
VVLNPNGTPAIDMESIYAASSPKGPPPVGELIDVQYGNRTWSSQKHVIISSAGLWSSASLRNTFAHLHPAVRRVRLDGHKAIELSWVIKGGPKGPRIGRTANHFWVDARTYLPLLATTSWGPHSVSRTDFRLLPATPANLAKLRVHVPPGFRRTQKVVK